MTIVEIDRDLKMPTEHLATIRDKVLDQKRLTPEEGLSLLEEKDERAIDAILNLADYMRQIRVGETVHYASSLFLYPTNLCELNCQFCSFYAKPGWKSAWFNTPEQIEQIIRERVESAEPLTEVHIVGGLWRECNLPYYEDLFGRIQSIDRQLHIKALTPVEYDFLAKLHDISIEEVLKRMMSWGLGSLPGGGAEILVEEVRKKIAPGKITSQEFLDVHKLAHHLGLKSNITMLFNHIESHEDIISHLSLTRELQDETGGFKTFIPLKFGEENNALGKRKQRLRGKNIALIYATSRLMLDNIPNIKVMWNYVGVNEGLKYLQVGGNDFSSTNTKEKVIDMAGGVKIAMDSKMMDSLIRSIGRTPQLTHSGVC